MGRAGKGPQAGGEGAGRRAPGVTGECQRTAALGSRPLRTKTVSTQGQEGGEVAMVHTVSLREGTCGWHPGPGGEESSWPTPSVTCCAPGRGLGAGKLECLLETEGVSGVGGPP